MQNIGFSSHYRLENHGLLNLETIFWNFTLAELIEQSITKQEGILSSSGALVVSTGKHTGRSPDDKFLTHSQNIDEDEIWWGKINQHILS